MNEELIFGTKPGKFEGVDWKSRQNERILGKMGKGDRIDARSAWNGLKEWW
jgi:hypothetical protein